MPMAMAGGGARVREALPSDLDGLYAVAQHLDTLNLPADRGALAEVLARSGDSFAGRLPVFEREYLFVLEYDGRVGGTSMIHAQHGTRRAPHLYFDVLEEERFSVTLDRHVRHRLLRLGECWDGPTEIGGLVVQPELRRAPGRVGTALSYARFIYMGAHRDRFRDEVLSELLPALEPDGSSLLWEAIGRRFTGLSYREADRLSRNNKEFIRGLFPRDAIHVCLLPREAQALIGVVGPKTRAVETMLSRIGFRFAGRIDPFDGGPHFTARASDLTLLSALRSVRVEAGDPQGAQSGLVAVVRDQAPRFTAVSGVYEAHGETARLTSEVRAALDLAAGDPVWLVAI